MCHLIPHSFKPLCFALALLPGLAFGIGQTTRVSVDANGLESNGYTSEQFISADGRFVAFSSLASNLVTGDTNNFMDVFVKDRLTGKITRASVNSFGEESNSYSFHPWISQNGKQVAFFSNATNLVSGVAINVVQIYFHDMDTGETTRIPVAPDINGQYSNIFDFSVSADGRFVAFSALSNLPHSGCKTRQNTFVHDRQTAKTQCASINADGVEGDGFSIGTAISADGSFIAFASYADNLVPGDTNNIVDIFVRNRLTGELNRASINSKGEQSIYNGVMFGGSYAPALSANGRFVVFNALTYNLADNDINDNSDVFIHDQLTGETARINVNSAGNEALESSYSFGKSPISADGRFVAFVSAAPNLVTGDTNGTLDTFVRDRKTKITTRESVTSKGFQIAEGSDTETTISADGRWLAFASNDSHVVPGDTNKTYDVFVRDRLLDTKNTTDLALAVAGPESVTANSQAVYIFTVSNNGGINAENTAVITHFSTQGSVKKIVAAQGQCSKAATSVCRLGTLVPGQSIDITATVNVKGATTINASVNAAPKDNKPINNSQSLITIIQ